MIAELREIYKDHDTARKGALFATTGKVLTVEDYSRSALAAPGDPVRGQRVFHEVGCISCHAVAGYGNPIGPEMTTIGAQLPQAELIDSILYPSKKVRDGYQISILETLQGGTLSGMIKSETGESISLVDAAGVSMTIFKKDLKNRIASPLSLMPAGLHAGLTLEQFTDLTAYLESLKSDRETPRSACAGSARPPARKRPHPVP